MTLSNYGQKTSRRRGNCYNLKGLRFTQRTLPGSHRTRLVRAHLGGRLPESDARTSGVRIRTRILHLLRPLGLGGGGSVVRCRSCSSRKEGPLTRAARRTERARGEQGMLGIGQIHIPVATANCSAGTPSNRTRDAISIFDRVPDRCRSRGSLSATAPVRPGVRCRLLSSTPFSGHTNGGYPQLDHARRNLRQCLPNCRRSAQKREQRR
jgi:hypothetical protein